MEAEHDELATNPFFVALQQQEQLMQAIAKEEALVCVPAAESLKLCKLTHDFLSTHILTPSPHLPDNTYTTKNGKTCSFQEGRVICRTGFPRPRTVMVVYEETYYDDDFNSIKILRTNFPLLGKIPMNYYKNVAQQASLDVATLNARTLPEHQAILCRLSGQQYSSVAYSNFSPEQSLANIGSSPSPHVTAFPNLPPIFLALQKFIYSFNSSYVLVKGFLDHAGMKVKDAAERMKGELSGGGDGKEGSSTPASKDKSSAASSSASASKLTRTQSMEASAAIESCIFAGIHRKLFLGLIELYRAEEMRTQTLLINCVHLSMEDLGVRPELICTPSTAIQHLQEAINGSFAITPLQKLSVLEDTNRLLTEAVDAQLAVTRSNTAASATLFSSSDPGGAPDPSDTVKPDTTLAADDMLPFWIFLIIHARFQFIHANLAYLQYFQSSTNSLINIQAMKVHLVNLQAAVQYIDSGKLTPGLDVNLNSTSASSSLTGGMIEKPRQVARATTLVTNSLTDLSVRDTRHATSIIPTRPKAGSGASNPYHHTLPRNFQHSPLESTLSIEDEYEQLQAELNGTAGGEQQRRSSGASSDGTHQRNRSNGSMPSSLPSSSSHNLLSGSSSTSQLSALTPTSTLPSSRGTSLNRASSINYQTMNPNRHPHPSHGGPSAYVAPQLVRLHDVASSNHSRPLQQPQQSSSAMGSFLSGLQRQDDTVTGRLEKGQSLFGNPSPSAAAPQSSASSRRPQQQPPLQQGGDLMSLIDADELPPLVVQRANPSNSNTNSSRRH